MSRPKTIELTIDGLGASQPLVFTAKQLVCCGWVGKDPHVLQAHIDELALLGVAPPARLPIYMNLSTHLVDTDDEVDVVSATTSGEYELALRDPVLNRTIQAGYRVTLLTQHV
jgi:4-hydroxyphenylacetate 3-monooxygenase